MSAAGRTQGFTLIELMITVALLAIMAMIAVPSFTQFTQNNQLQAKAEEMKSFLNFARTEAVLNRAMITVKSKDENDDYVASDAAVKWVIERPSSADDTPLRILDFNPDQAKIVALDTSGSVVSELTYRPNGLVNAPVNFTVCREQKTENGYLIVVPATGGSRLYERGKQQDDVDLSTCE